MIARIRFDGTEAVLGDDLTWTAPGVIGDALAAMIESEDRSPARGQWWISHVEAMAEMLGGTAEFEPKAPPTPGRIY